jgi:hypothetical protein
MENFVFLPGSELAARGKPLGRFLPPIPQGMTEAFLSSHAIPRGGWVLDPFGAEPRMAVEAARRGNRVLVAVNNPVTRFLLEMAAEPPSQAQFQAALAELASARKGEERIETHLQALYLTECPRCRRMIPAEAFLWEKGGEVPVKRIIQCECGEAGEFPATAEDRARASGMARTASMHRARALERVAALNDPDRVHAEEALDCYLPRAIYALITIINKLDGLALTPETRRCLLALILFACDEANTLWSQPEDRPRPKQLTIPPRFREQNVWLALERGVKAWASGQAAVPVVAWPKLPAETGGICLFTGPVRDLAEHLKEIPIQAAVSAMPRPNQAFWTLSALWAGWLWGREAVGAFKSVLHRRRYDWAWHAGALMAAFKHLAESLPPAVAVFGLVGEPEPGSLTAALVASESAGFDLRGMALRTAQDPVQLLWQRRPYLHAPTHPPDAQMIREALQEYLAERGEPVTYLHMHAAALASLAVEQALCLEKDELTHITVAIQTALSNSLFVHLGGTQNVETGLWGLKDWGSEAIPLPDRVEMEAVKHLQEHPEATFQELEAVLCRELPGLLTPPLGLLREVLASYTTANGERWSLRPEDGARQRRADLDEAAQSITRIGERLGFGMRVEDEPVRRICWEREGEECYIFHLLASAVAGKALRANPCPAERCLLVLPGGRAGLLMAKLRRDPTLIALWSQGWRALKFRLLRRLAEMPDLTLERFEQELATDPVTAPEQMKMF